MEKDGVKYEITNQFTAEAVVNASIGYSGVIDDSTMSDHMIVPEKCSFWTKIKCGAALVACGAICYVSLGTGCIACLAGLGKGNCLSCFTK
jgi:hypothetical protein